MAIVAAILAGPPAGTSGCARCDASTPAVTGTAWAQPTRFRPQRIWRGPLARRWTRETRTVALARTGAIGGSYFVCVRACDGGFFPVPYGGDRDSLGKICQALCPNADVQLYSMPLGGEIEDAVSTSGGSYANFSNAGKFEQTLDPNCSCRRKEQGWAQALAAAEARAQRRSGDILVTPEMSEQMSRPVVVPKASAAAAYASEVDALALVEMSEPPTLLLDANGVDIDLSAAPRGDRPDPPSQHPRAALLPFTETPDGAAARSQAASAGERRRRRLSHRPRSRSRPVPEAR